jgi:hypothetical protein
MWLWLFFKVFFTQKYIKIIFFIFKKLFLILTHQNDLKTQKNINLKKNKKNLIFLKTHYTKLPLEVSKPLRGYLSDHYINQFTMTSYNLFKIRSCYNLYIFYSSWPAQTQHQKKRKGIKT